MTKARSKTPRAFCSLPHATTQGNDGKTLRRGMQMFIIFAVSSATTHVILPKTLRRGDAKAETIGFARTSSAYRWSLLLRKERDSNP